MSLDISRTNYFNIVLYCIFNQRNNSFIIAVSKIKFESFLTRELQTNQDKHNKETNKNPKVKLKLELYFYLNTVYLSDIIIVIKIAIYINLYKHDLKVSTPWYKHTPTRNIANMFDVPATQVLPVHPVEHWHLLGETQDP